MTGEELWDLRLSLAKDGQVRYILDQLNAAQGPAGVHTEVLP